MENIINYLCIIIPILTGILMVYPKWNDYHKTSQPTERREKIISTLTIIMLISTIIVIGAHLILYWKTDNFLYNLIFIIPSFMCSIILFGLPDDVLNLFIKEDNKLHDKISSFLNFVTLILCIAISIVEQTHLKSCTLGLMFIASLIISEIIYITIITTKFIIKTLQRLENNQK